MKSRTCANCDSEENLTEHHLIPRAIAKRMLKKDRPYVKKIILCRSCHDIVHRLANPNILAKIFNTKERVISLITKGIRITEADVKIGKHNYILAK